MNLIVGYGNPDRQDDGLAWHVLCGIARRLGRPIPTIEEGFSPSGDDPDLLFVLQLTPELAELVAEYTKVAFVDAHIGTAIPEDICITQLEANYRASPLSHHMTPETCLALAGKLYGKTPQGVLISARGDEFGFTHQLSATAEGRVEQTTLSVCDFLGLC